MDSVVVLGDVRIHELRGEFEETVLGGAMLMKSAVHTALEELRLPTKPRVFSHKADSEITRDEQPPRDAIYGKPSAGLVRWQLERKHHHERQPARYRLFRQQNIGNVTFASLEDELLSKLVDGGFAGRVTAGNTDSGKQLAPDVTIIDDLGLGISRLRFDLKIDGEQIVVGTPDFALKLRKQFKACELETAPGDAGADSTNWDSSQFRDLSDRRAAHIETALKALTSRLKAAAERVGKTGRVYPLEPVVVLSASGELPDLCDASMERCDKGTVWEHLYADQALRKRTIVLLDSVNLRREISISSGLSWERTAQDTIIEFKRSPKLRPLLEFGHVIIRFGLTGVLLISKEDQAYTLYFNPDRDDSKWTHPEKDGRVLGETALLAASIVEHLTERCNWRSGEAILSDLRVAIDRALLLAVQRFLTHHELGYGHDANRFRKRKEACWFDPRAFCSAGQALELDHQKLTHISPQRIRLAPFRSRHWSILMQSSQPDLNNVAQDIVRYGSKVVLNTLNDPFDVFVEGVLDGMIDELRKKLPMYSLFTPLRDSPSDVSEPGDQQPAKGIKGIIDRMRYHLEQPLKDPNSWETFRRLFGSTFSRGISKLHRHFDSITDVDEREVFGPNPTLRRPIDQLTNGLRRLHIRGLALDEQLQKIGEYVLGQSPTEDHICNAVDMAETVLSSGETTNKCFRQRAEYAIHLLRGLPHFSKRIQDCEKKTLDCDWLLRRAFWDFKCVIATQSDALGNEPEVRDAIKQIEDEEFLEPRREFHDILVNFTRQVVLLEAGQLPSEPVATPILRLGKEPNSANAKDIDKRLVVIDRKEVESIRAVQRMIENYLMLESEPDRPLSIAVFGPPGAGKSVAVKRIIDMQKGKSDSKEKPIKTEELTINLAQLPGIEALNREFDDLAKIKDAVPIVFFDEFDSALREQEHGWLKYFLAAMEDGKHCNDEVKRAVFVFAGGTCNSFEEFSLADRSRTDPQWLKFSQQKGPDFVSRLRGHINVVGINPSGQDDDLYLIRRALALRFQLDGRQNLGDCGEAEIDEYLLNAFLHVPHYRHGARSMRMLLDLCTGKNDRTISMSEVPPIHQLNMQVDGKAFADLASGQTKPIVDARRQAGTN